MRLCYRNELNTSQTLEFYQRCHAYVRMTYGLPYFINNANYSDVDISPTNQRDGNFLKEKNQGEEAVAHCCMQCAMKTEVDLSWKSIIGYWPLNEQKLMDLVGHGHTHGESHGNVSIDLVPGAIEGKALRVSGYSPEKSYVEINQLHIGFKANFSVAMRVKSHSFTGYHGVHQFLHRKNSISLGTQESGSSKVCFTINGKSSTTSACHEVIMPQEWHHFLGTFSHAEGRIRLYVDGELEKEVTITDGLDDEATYSDTYTIGGNEEEVSGFDGWIDDVLIYNVELDEIEVECLFLLPSNP
eukprot:jgi/Bigna1/134002/aug1.23_g8710